MSDYQKMYHALFNEISKIIEQLQEVQQRTEEMYVSSNETPLIIVKKAKSD